jgi:hypothetical protein
MLRDDESEQHTSWDPENAFSGLSFMPFSRSFLKVFFKVGHELVDLFGLDHDVIHICLDGLSNEIAKIF